MKFKFQHLIYLAFFSILSACTADYLSVGEVENPGEETSSGDPFSINVIIEDPSSRTRTVNFEENAALRINQIWMGIYEVATGNRIAYNSKSLGYQTVQAGERKQNMFRMDMPLPENFTPNPNGYVIVSLANYVGVLDENMDNIEGRLAEADTWQKFNDIAVDVNTAYTDMHSNIAPVLAGFLYDYDESYYQNNNDKKTISTHVKIDQFKENAQPNSSEIMLSPKAAVEKVIINYDNTLDQGQPKGFNFSTKTLRLRRLVANINVNIVLEENALKKLRLTDVSYKRYNMPKAVYIIERRTTNCELDQNGRVNYPSGNIADYNKEWIPARWQDSPNFADRDPEKYYYNDADWQYGNVTGFSFQHFANKHWARNEVQSQRDRERCAKYGTYPDGTNKYYYKALVKENLQNDNYGKENEDNDGEIFEDFNNYASYFVVKMHLVDNETGRALEAEYTIHEGYTSDELGDAIENDDWWDENKKENENKNKDFMQYVRLKDYVVARNIDYTYTIHINGVNDIYYNVESNSSAEKHNNGQGGKVWEFFYVTDYYDVNKEHPEGDKRMTTEGAACSYAYGSFAEGTTVPPGGGYYRNAIYINNTNPDIAFRLYGYNTDTKKIEGYNYNFSQDAFSWLSGLWPPSAGASSRYFAGYDELIAFQDQLPPDFKNGLSIIDPDYPNDPMNIIEFVGMIHSSNGDNTTIGKFYDINVSPTNINEKDFSGGLVPWAERNKYVRAIYIADAKGQSDLIDGCTTLVNIFAGAQYPKLTSKPAIEKTPLPLPSFESITIDSYLVIDENLKRFSIPTIYGLDELGYDYKVTINGKDYSEYRGASINGRYFYDIPISEFEGKTGEIKLQAVLSENAGTVRDSENHTYEELYNESEEVVIGEVKLKDPYTWGGTEAEWQAALSHYGTSGKADDYHKDGGYLYFISNGSTLLLNNGNNDLRLNGGNARIYFYIYQPCKIVINDWYANSRTTTLLLNDEFFEVQNVPQTSRGSKTITFTIKASDMKAGANKVTIQPSGNGGQNVTSVQVVPL